MREDSVETKTILYKGMRYCQRVLFFFLHDSFPFVF